MNKWFLLVFVALLGMAGCGLWDKNFSRQASVHCNPTAAVRVLSDPRTWAGSVWQLDGGNYPSVNVHTVLGDRSIGTTITVVSQGASDSIALLWTGKGEADLDREMTQELPRLQALLNSPKNVYGMDVNKIMWKDSVLLVTELVTSTYPSVADLYKKIDSLRAYIAHEGRKETDPPMLNVVHTRMNYKSTIAVPLDREVMPVGDFSVQRFVPWKVLTGTVSGGPMTAERAMDQLRLYVLDYQQTAMAMPFQSLETERNKEPDTAKWVTRVVVPVP